MRPSLASVGAGLALFCAACAGRPLYVEPPPTAPHAIVKIRLVHHARPGPMHTGSVVLNDRVVEFPVDPSAPATRAFRVKPEAASWRIGTEFYHTVTRTETYTTTESYQCGSTPGYNGTSTPQYCTRQVQHTRTVTDHITDAACAAVMMHAPAAGTIYVLQYDFTGTRECSAKCLEQKMADDGTFKLEPCIGSRSGMAQ